MNDQGGITLPFSRKNWYLATVKCRKNYMLGFTQLPVLQATFEFS